VTSPGEPAQQYFRQQEHAQRLPEGDDRTCKKVGYQPVPKLLGDEGERCQHQQAEQNPQQNSTTSFHNHNDFFDRDSTLFTE
jgi:hypothetical protein